MTVERIVFTGDFLRPDSRRWKPSQVRNVRWLRDVLGEPVAMACNLPIELSTWAAGEPSGLQMSNGQVETIYSEMGVPLSVDGWAAVHDADRPPAALLELAEKRFSGSLVIGIEIPPILYQALKHLDIPVVDVIVHPVRFLDDVFLGIRSSSPEASATLENHAIDRAWVRLIAGIQKATAARQLEKAPAEKSALFLMQVTHDLSQISEGRFLTTKDFRDEIAALSEQFATVYVKDHPFQPKSELTQYVFDHCRNAKATSENFYRLVSAPGIESVVSISSGACQEAGFFGKDARTLYRPPHELVYRGESLGDHAFAGVFDAFLAPDFWRDLIRPFTPVTPKDGLKPPFKPNRMRTSLGAFWGFNAIDSDIAVQQYFGSLPTAERESLVASLVSKLRSGR